MSGLMNLFAKKPESFITVDCGELEQIIESEGSNIGLIDVRTEREHHRGHIPNSENVNESIISAKPCPYLYIAS